MVTCVICGKEAEKMPFEDVCSMECFTEKFWREKEEGYLNGVPYIIVDGNIYKDGGRKNPKGSCELGFSGAEFNIRMNDGTEFSTNNLWHNGKIPENHREILKDNAIFIRRSNA